MYIYSEHFFYIKLKGNGITSNGLLRFCGAFNHFWNISDKSNWCEFTDLHYWSLAWRSDVNMSFLYNSKSPRPHTHGTQGVNPIKNKGLGMKPTVNLTPALADNLHEAMQARGQDHCTISWETQPSSFGAGVSASTCTSCLKKKQQQQAMTSLLTSSATSSTAAAHESSLAADTRKPGMYGSGDFLLLESLFPPFLTQSRNSACLQLVL